MSNKLALYKNPEVIAVVNEWFQTTHDNDFYEPAKILGVADMYQSYHHFTLPIQYTHYRMDINMFAKCLAAAKILDIGGRWRYAENYQPSKYELTRATA